MANIQYITHIRDFGKIQTLSYILYISIMILNVKKLLQSKRNKSLVTPYIWHTVSQFTAILLLSGSLFSQYLPRSALSPLPTAGKPQVSNKPLPRIYSIACIPIIPRRPTIPTPQVANYRFATRPCHFNLAA
jgi:hypothetical protein